MKTRNIVSTGIMGALALASAMGITACGAESAESESAIGSASEALITPSGPIRVEFPAEYALDSHNVVSLGGYNPASSFAGTTIAGIYNLDTGVEVFTPLVLADGTTAAPLPTALGESQIVELSTKRLLVVGGRASKDAAGARFTAILKLDVNNNGHLEQVEWITSANSLPQLPANTGRAAGKLVKCGSKALYIGGAFDKGMIDLANVSESNRLEVFTDNATPSSATWAQMKDSNNDTLTLAHARAYPFLLPQSSTSFAVSGGIDSNGMLKSTEVFTVDSNCKLTSNPNPNVIPAGTDMPGFLAQGTSIAAAPVISSTTYDALVIGGVSTTGQAVAAVAYAYQFSGNAWATAAAPTTGRAFGHAVPNKTTSTSVDFVGGVIDDASGTLFYNSSDVIQTYVPSTNTWNTQAALGARRVGAFIQSPINSKLVAGFGTDYVNGVANPVTTIENL